MNRITFIIAVICLSFMTVSAQEILEPQDYLTKEFHKERREAFRELLPENSVAVFFANPVRNRANDVDYIYHQDPNFYYLTGFKEPHSVLLIFSDMQTNDKGESFNEIIFVQRRDQYREMYDGKRLGVEGVQTKLGFEQTFYSYEFKDNKIDLTKFDRVIFTQFNNDVRDNSRDDGDLYSIIEQFKDKVDYPIAFDPNKDRLYKLIKATDFDNKSNVAQIIARVKSSLNYNPSLNQDEVLKRFLSADNEVSRKQVVESIPATNLDVGSMDQIMGILRETKLPEEMKLLKKAIEISCVGQIEVMKAMKPSMSEKEIQGIHEFVFKKYNSEYEGYPSIVGAGHNGCVLHYITNTKPSLGNNLVLMDLGAEYHGYTADITRTIPANGKFSPEQKAIYELVLRAQDEAIAVCRAGTNFRETHRVAKKVIDKGLAELGIIKEGQSHRYFPHGTSHYIGLDVHDKGTYGPFKPNTVITVEPGIYIPEDSDCDPKWWGIAVRIEDDILITEGDPVNLSALAPRTVEDIEKMMALPSPLNDFVLPDLDD